MLKTSEIEATFPIKDSIKVCNYILRFFITLKFTCEKRYINKQVPYNINILKQLYFNILLFKHFFINFTKC
jgi:hypothetical protein